MTETEARVDPLTGRPVWVTGGRQSRPNRPVVAECPFCVGGLEAPQAYDVRSFVNRWPAMPDDRCEVVLYSPDHDADVWLRGGGAAAKVVQLWADRTEAIGRRDDIAYVLPFENRGVEVGATIPHPHGQIYAFDDVPPAALGELDRVASGDCCPLCQPVWDGAGLQVGGEPGGSVAAWAHPAPSWPFELLLATIAHVPDLVAARDHGLVPAVADAIADAVRRLDGLFDAPMPYMLWVHQRPTDGGHWPGAHLHIHLAPYFRAPGLPRFVAAGELGSGVYFNPIAPEDAAERLRAVRV